MFYQRILFFVYIYFRQTRYLTWSAWTAQTSAKTSNFNQNWSGIRIRISGLFRVFDPDVCRVVPKMLWIHYLVGVSHFAECRENRPVTAREMLINLLSPIPQWRGPVNQWTSDPESVSGMGSSSTGRSNHNVKFNEIGRLLLPGFCPGFHVRGSVSKNQRVPPLLFPLPLPPPFPFPPFSSTPLPSRPLTSPKSKSP